MTGEIGGAIDAAIETEVDARARDSQIITTFEADSGRLRRIFELDQYLAEVKFLERIGAFHVLVVGPDALHGYERHGKVWSRTYDNLAGAVEGAKEQLKKHKDRFDRRTSGQAPTQPDGGVEMAVGGAAADAVEAHSPSDLPDEMWAVFDVSTAGFARQGRFGQVVFETRGEAEDLAARKADYVVVRVDPSGGTMGRHVEAAISDSIPASDLEEGDRVVVHVNSRAADHLGTPSFEAEVVDVAGASGGGMPMGVTFRPVGGPITPEQTETHTWYPDIGYIHGYHTGLERHSDIGKVSYVEPA